MNWDQCLYLIADFSYGEDRIYEALRAGVDAIQLREKDLSSAEYLRRAMRLREMTRDTDTIFIVNDRLDIALLSDADGVHLGASDVPVARARELLGQDKIIGATAKTVSQAKLAKESGADYIGSGAWAQTTTKKDAVPISEEVYREILAVSGLKNVAVGGITVENCDRPLSCGASGLAVSAGILQGDIRSNIAGFREKLALAKKK